jgi:hypothetical protein
VCEAAEGSWPLAFGFCVLAALIKFISKFPFKQSENTAEGGCAKRASIAAEFIPRRLGFFYPIKPKPGLIGAHPAVHNF